MVFTKLKLREIGKKITEKVAKKAYDAITTEEANVTRANENTGWLFRCGTICVDLVLNLQAGFVDTPYVIANAGEQVLQAVCSDQTHEKIQFNLALFNGNFPRELELELSDKVPGWLVALKEGNWDTEYISTSASPSPNRKTKLLISLPKEADAIEHGFSTTTRWIVSDDGGYIDVDVKYRIIETAHANDVDVTERFSLLYADAVKAKGDNGESNRSTFNASFPEAKDLHFLLIPGLFTEHYPGYYKKNCEWLTSLELGGEVVQIDTDAGTTTNAAVISNAVREAFHRTKKRLVLIGHSKGGVDIVQALLDHSDIHQMIYGIITMQSPFGGTHVVDWLIEESGLQRVARKVVEDIWGGEKDSYGSLSAKFRRHFNTHHFETLRDLTRSFSPIGFVSISSYADFKSARTLGDLGGIVSMKMTADQMRGVGFLCDGLVALEDARLPGSDNVKLADMFHTEPALHLAGSRYHSGALTQVVIELLIEKKRRLSH